MKKRALGGVTGTVDHDNPTKVLRVSQSNMFELPPMPSDTQQIR